MSGKHEAYLKILEAYLEKKENIKIIGIGKGVGCPVIPDITAIDLGRDIRLFYELKVKKEDIRNAIYQLEMVKVSAQQQGRNSASFVVIPEELFNEISITGDYVWLDRLFEKLGYGVLLIKKNEVLQLKCAFIDENINREKIVSMENVNEQTHP